MSTKVTKGGLVGLLAGVGLGMIFPPLGAALVIAGALGGGIVGHALDESDQADKNDLEPDQNLNNADELLDEFQEWDRKLTGSAAVKAPGRLPGSVPAARPGAFPGSSPGPSSTAPRRSFAPGAPSTPTASRRAGGQPSRGSGASLYEQVAAAEALLKAGRFLEAIDSFRQLKTRLLESTSGVGASDRQRVVEGLRLALHRLAGVLIENDSPAEAEDLLKESLELAPGDRDTLLHLARLQLMLNDPSRAEPHLVQAIESHPSDPEAYRLLGDVYVESGRLEEARSLFEQSVAQAQDSAVTIEMLERISGLDPTDSRPLVELGRAQARENNWEEAARAYRQARARSPEDGSIRLRLGSALLHLGKTQEGIDLLRDAPGLRDDVEALGELAHVFAEARDDDAAMPLLRRLRELDRSFEALDPVERRSALRDCGLSGDQIDSVYAPLRLRALLDFAAVETRSGAVDEAAAAAREALSYGGTAVSASALDVTTALAAEYDRQGRPADSAHWMAETTRLGGSLERVRQDRDTYEDFLRRFKYHVQDLVAEGGMARVYRGVDTRTGRAVAIKRMHDRFCTDPQAVAYFYREVRALEELSRPYPHENIVEFIASGITESRFIFAMEFVEGPSLRQLMDRGDLPELPELCRLVEAICAGLDRAHNSVRGIVHRDLKPENVLLTPENVPKLTDFGICRVSSLFSTSRRYYGSTHSFVGTSLYSAPEQYPDPYSGQVPTVDGRADLYSLGCIIYELLTTQPPFMSDEPGLIGLMHQRRPLPGQAEAQPLPPPSERNPLALQRFTVAQQQALDAIVMRCLELKPARRYRSAAQVRTEFEKLRSEAVSGE